MFRPFYPGINWIGGWVGPRAGLDDVKRTFLIQQLDRPAHRQSLYRLRYPGSYYKYLFTENNRKLRGVCDRV
jgi:hypothetical protein